MFFAKITAPHRGLLFINGKPKKVLEPGLHFVPPVVSSVVRVSCALRTEETELDVITKGGTPTRINVGYTARIKDIAKSVLNVDNPFATLKASVIAVISGGANNYTIDQLAQNKTQIAQAAAAELRTLSEDNGWGLGDFQVAIGDPSMSDELEKLLMREEAVRRENAANLDRARNQLEVARQLQLVARELEHSPFAQELLRMQMLTDMGEGGKVIVVDSKLPGGRTAASVAGSLGQQE